MDLPIKPASTLDLRIKDLQAIAQREPLGEWERNFIMSVVVYADKTCQLSGRQIATIDKILAKYPKEPS